MTNNFLPFLIAFVTSTSLCNAQTEKIDTDRPDQTESAVTVPKKWIQFEMGFLKQSDNYRSNEHEIIFQHPTLLTKYGVTKWAELRLITTYGTERVKSGNVISYRLNGIQSVQLGGKFNFFKEKGLRPKTSIIAHYDFARLRTPYRDTIDGVNFRFTMQHTLTKKISVGYNLGMEWPRFGSPPAYIYTFAPGLNISENWYCYLEIFGSFYKNRNAQHSIDGGLAYFVSDNLKLDLSSGFGISRNAPDWYLAVGGSFRFKTGK